MLNFRFEDPWWLLAMLPLAVLGYLAVRRRRGAAVLFSDVSILKRLPKTAALRVKRLPAVGGAGGAWDW